MYSEPRIAARIDIPGMHKVRVAVRENALTSAAVTEESYTPAIEETGRGWVVECEGEIVAFAVGNKETGNIWALFVHPDHEGRGLGQVLHTTMIDWLFKQGLSKLDLATEPNTRAAQFYETAGWSCTGIDTGGDAIYELRKSSEHEFSSALN